jgi:hypothetical protein
LHSAVGRIRARPASTRVANDPAQQIDQHRSIHCAGRRAGNAIDSEPRLLEQTIQHAPCECPMRAYAKGGAAGARTALDDFWRRVSEAARFSPFRRGPLDVLLGRWTLDSSPLYVIMDLMSRLLSPYDLNPMGKNPLRAILAEAIDFERLARAPIKLFITATNVRTGRGHVFKNDAITPDVLLALAHHGAAGDCCAAVFRACL